MGIFMKKTVLFLTLIILGAMMLGCVKKREELEDYQDHTKLDIGKVDPIVIAPDFEASPTPTEPPRKPYVLCLDAGHGGKWTGAMYSGRVEKIETVRMCKAIREYLLENHDDIEVFLTREDPEDVLSTDLGEDLRKRVEYAKSVDAQILVSLHLNASDKHNLGGTEVLISKQPNITGISQELGDALLNGAAGLGLRNRGTVKKNSQDTFDENGVPVDYYAICRHGSTLNIPAVILEMCFMDNANDCKFVLATDEAVKKFAAAEGEAIYQFLKSHYTK